jgi:hypothetical protein
MSVDRAVAGLLVSTGCSANDYDVAWVACAMRRRFQKFLPIVLIALVVQVLAPVGATLAVAIAAADPLHAAPICHGGQTLPASQGDQGGGGRAHDGVCSFCCAAQASASLDTPAVASITVPIRVIAGVIWRDEAPDVLAAHAGFHAQARAPPLSM